ncbi:MAG: hypothetical protein IJE84_00870, partial [Clostridia bacterium]|nr:hypothetical protein [Clostridia bacterium]
SAYTGDGSAAGIVGFDAAAQKGSASSFTFRNITIDASNSIGAVDGSWDVHVGGLVGYLSADSSVLMDNCHTAQKLGVNVSADGEYVGAGMLVGSVDKRNGTVLDTSLITAQDSSVYFIDATPTDQLLSGYGFGITPVRAGELDGVVTGTGTPYFYDKFVGQDREAVTNTTLTLGELFSSDVSAFAVNSDDVQIFVESISGNASVAYEQNTDDWSATTLSVTGLGSLKVTICDYYFCKTESAVLSVVEPTPTEKFTLKFPNTDTYLYRVGNGNAVTLGTLFGTVDGAAIDSQGVTVEITKKNASMNVAGTLTANSTDWTKSTIQFAGTGVVTLTVTDNDYCIPRELTVEIVDGNNATSAKSAMYAGNVVLLSDVKISAGSAVYYRGCTVYGNGFTYDVVGGVNKASATTNYHGIIDLESVIFDNVVVVGEVYQKYGAYKDNDDYTAAIVATNSTITNCHISNCSAPIRSKGNNTIVDTTLYGGTIANMIIEDGTNTLRNVTTVNYNDGHGAIGFGILISAEATDNVKLVLDGSFVQYNYVCQADGSVITDSSAKMLYNAMFDSNYSTFHVNVDGATYVNPGVLSMKASFDVSDIDDKTGNGYVGAPVSFSTGLSTETGYLYSIPASKVTLPFNDYNGIADTHNASVQGALAATPVFSLGSQAQDGDDRYLKGDISGVEARYILGETAFSLDLTALMTVYKYTGINCPVDVTLYDAQGNAVARNTTVTLNNAGEYEIVFTATDSLVYDQYGALTGSDRQITYIVPLSVII